MKALLKELSLVALVEDGPGEMEEEGEEMGGQVRCSMKRTSGWFYACSGIDGGRRGSAGRGSGVYCGVLDSPAAAAPPPPSPPPHYPHH